MSNVRWTNYDVQCTMFDVRFDDVRCRMFDLRLAEAGEEIKVN